MLLPTFSTNHCPTTLDGRAKTPSGATGFDFQTANHQFHAALHLVTFNDGSRWACKSKSECTRYMCLSREDGAGQFPGQPTVVACLFWSANRPANWQKWVACAKGRPLRQRNLLWMGLELSEDGIPLRVHRAGVEARKGDGEDLVLLLGASRKGTYMIHEPKKLLQWIHLGSTNDLFEQLKFSLAECMLP